MAINNNRTNPPIPKNTRKPPTATNNWNCRRCNTSKYGWLHGSCSHTSMGCNIKSNDQKDVATFCDDMEGSDNYCRTTAEW